MKTVDIDWELLRNQVECLDSLLAKLADSGSIIVSDKEYEALDGVANLLSAMICINEEDGQGVYCNTMLYDSAIGSEKG